MVEAEFLGLAAEVFAAFLRVLDFFLTGCLGIFREFQKYISQERFLPYLEGEHSYFMKVLFGKLKLAGGTPIFFVNCVDYRNNTCHYHERCRERGPSPVDKRLRYKYC